MGHSLFAFLIVLGILIFFHEFGHFLTARLFGVGVEKFSLGFGPRIFGRKLGLTDYRISLLPLGGYVKMVGEEPDEELPPEQIPLSFTHKPVLQRMLIVFAGPFFNILLALLIFWVIAFAAGITILQPVIGMVRDPSPARSAGFEPGDRVLAVDGMPVDSWEAMADRIHGSLGREIAITVEREGSRRVLRVTPEPSMTRNLLGEETPRYIIGIGSAGAVETRPLGIVEAAAESLRQTAGIVAVMVRIVAKLLTGGLPVDTVGGPLMIAQMAGDQARAGIASLFQFIAVISVNLAVINLLPIPVLDGGHLLFFAIEAVRGRPVRLKVREIAQQVGMVLLIMLMILVFYNDITRLFFSS
ncbi:MAG: RIP metalloprotease RseP [Desulfobacterales bacterium]